MSVKDIVIFASGLAIGGGAGYFISNYFLSKKKEKEVESIREAYMKDRKIVEEEMYDSVERANLAEQELNSELERKAAESTKREKGPYVDYTQYSNTKSQPEFDEEPNEYVLSEDPDPVVPERTDRAPYVIDPQEVDWIDGYNEIELSYFSDGVLADDRGNRMMNVDELVGRASLKRFGEYERDSVYVRNERLGCIFIILAVEQSYDEYLEEHPEVKIEED